MTLALLLSRPCTITRRTPSASETDESGDAVNGKAIVETVCELQQKIRDEPAAAGEASADEWLLVLPVVTELDTSDQVEVDGSVFEVVGHPWRADSGTPAVHHVEATVQRVGPAEQAS